MNTINTDLTLRRQEAMIGLADRSEQCPVRHLNHLNTVIIKYKITLLQPTRHFIAKAFIGLLPSIFTFGRRVTIIPLRLLCEVND